MTTATVLNSAGTGFTVTNTVLNSAGTSFNVNNNVLDADGNAFAIFSGFTTNTPANRSFTASDDRTMDTDADGRAFIATDDRTFTA